MNTVKKILVIVDSIDINDSSGSKANVSLILNLHKIGYKIKVFHYSRKEIQLDEIECISVAERKWSLFYVLSRAQRIFTRLTKININPIVESLLGFSFTFFNDVKSIKKAIYGEKDLDIDLVITLSQGTSFRPHYALLKLPQYHIKWLAYVHDPYPQHLYPRPYNFIEYGFKKKRYFFRDVTINAYKLVFPSMLLKDWMQSYFKYVEGKSLIIPHQMSKTAFVKASLPHYFDADKFNLLHAGNLLDLRDPKPLVLAYEKFLLEMPLAKEDTMFFFLGSKSVFHDFLYKKQQVMPQLYVSDGYVNFNDVFAMQRQVAVNIILEAKSEISPFLPGKFPHCVAANKPILVVGPYYSECKRLLGENYPYVFDFNEVDKIKESIKGLYLKWKENDHVLTLNRSDLEHYLSSDYLKEVIEKQDTI